MATNVAMSSKMEYWFICYNTEGDAPAREEIRDRAETKQTRIVGSSQTILFYTEEKELKKKGAGDGASKLVYMLYTNPHD